MIHEWLSILIPLLLIVALTLILEIITNKKINNNHIYAATLILIGAIATIYVRAIAFYGKMLSWSDESAYIQLIDIILKGQEGHVSGPAYIYTIILLGKITSIPPEYIMIFFGCLIGIIGSFIIFIFYDKIIKNKTYSFFSVITLLTTSYFIYPLIEARPTQVGLFLITITSFFFYKHFYEKKDINKIILFSLYFITFCMHILSFAILNCIIFGLLLWGIADKKVHIKKIFLPIIFILITIPIYISKLSPYNGNYRDIYGHMIEPTIRNLGIKIIFLPAILFVGTIFIIFFLKYISNFEKEKDKKIKLFFYILLLGAFLALAIQFKLNYITYFKVYHYSLIFFLVFQIGNIIFGTLYLLGIKEILNNSLKQDFFFKSSIILILAGIISLIISINLGWGFNNLMIRILNYWVIFAAPIAYIPLHKLKRTKIINTLLGVTISSIISISLINASRHPDIFNYYF